MAKIKEVNAVDFKELNRKNKIVLIDVSDQDKFNSGSIPNSVNAPYKIFKKTYNAYIDQTKDIYVTSNNGRLGKKACKFLVKKGIDATFIVGGSDAYGIKYNLVRLFKQAE